jgi:ribosome-associated translation inhibitor RaiA
MTNKLTSSDIVVHVFGDIPPDCPDYARHRLVHLLDRLSTPVRSLEVELRHEPDPAHEPPVLAKSTIDLDGHPVRAHVVADRVPEAIDLLVDTLKRRVRQFEERRG